MDEHIIEVSGNKEVRKATISYIVIMVLISAVIMVILTSLMARSNNLGFNELFNAITNPGDNDFVNNIAIQTFALTNFVTYILLTIVVTYFMYGFLQEDFIKIKEKLTKTIILSILLFILMLILTLLIGHLVTSIVGDTNSANQYNVSNAVTKFPILGFIMVVIFAPLVEELIFRKAIFEGFSNKMGLFLSTVIFSLMHMFGDNGGLLNTLVISLLYVVPALFLGIVYIKTNKNIYPVIIIHLLNNLIAFIVIMTI